MERFAGLDDDAWLAVHLADEQQHLPGLPSDAVQVSRNGSSGDAALRGGFNVFMLIKRLVEEHQAPLSSLESVLEFGCGWGRVLRFFLRDVPGSRLHGTDVDAQIIDFCRASNPWCNFAVNDALPPVPYPDASFDLIYAYSVFSHFSEPAHERWLEELRRIARPGGLVALSVRSRLFIERCRNIRTGRTASRFEILQRMFPDTDEALAGYDAGNYCFTPYNLHDGAAQWGEACVPLAYVRSRWTRHFDVVDIVEAAAATGLSQHLVLLRPLEPRHDEPRLTSGARATE